MTGGRILRAWAWLAVASAVTTSLAFAGSHGRIVAAALLLLALIKSRVILSDYLGLRAVPPIRRGFMVALVIWAGVALALVLAAGQP